MRLVVCSLSSLHVLHLFLFIEEIIRLSKGSSEISFILSSMLIFSWSTNSFTTSRTENILSEPIAMRCVLRHLSRNSIYFRNWSRCCLGWEIKSIWPCVSIRDSWSWDCTHRMLTLVDDTRRECVSWYSRFISNYFRDLFNISCRDLSLITKNILVQETSPAAIIQIDSTTSRLIFSSDSRIKSISKIERTLRGLLEPFRFSSFFGTTKSFASCGCIVTCLDRCDHVAELLLACLTQLECHGGQNLLLFRVKVSPGLTTYVTDSTRLSSSYILIEEGFELCF